VLYDPQLIHFKPTTWNFTRDSYRDRKEWKIICIPTNSRGGQKRKCQSNFFMLLYKPEYTKHTHVTSTSVPSFILTHTDTVHKNLKYFSSH